MNANRARTHTCKLRLEIYESRMRVNKCIMHLRTQPAFHNLAVDNHNQILTKDTEESPLILYTDGNGIDGRIGSAAVVDLEDQHAHCQMPDER